MDLPVGTVVARSYEILGPLGRGGMGELFVARNVRTERRVALKMLRPDAKQRQDAIERFRREARATGMVSSDHVTQVLDVEEDPVHGIAIAFELLEGESLLEYLRRTGVMSPEAIGPYVRQILRGLADAHSAGVIHRDLKPSNIFLERRSDGSTRVKILDFGISKLPRSMVKVTLTEPNQSLGSFMFMPPEQIQGAKDVDERADIYAMGTLIFQSLTGQLPFNTTAVAELVRVKTRGQARTMRDASGRVFPELLEAFVAKCLQADRALRFQTVLEMLSAWDSITQPGSSTAYPPPSSGAAPRPPAPAQNLNHTVPFRPGEHAPAPIPVQAQPPREDMAQTIALPSVRPMVSPFAPALQPGHAQLPATTVQPVMPEMALAPAYNPYASAAYAPPPGQGQQSAAHHAYGAPPQHPNAYGAPPSSPSGYLAPQPAYGQQAVAPAPSYGTPPPSSGHPSYGQAQAFANTAPPGFGQTGAAQAASGSYGQATVTPVPYHQTSSGLGTSQATPAKAASSWGPTWLIILVALLVLAAIAVVGVVIFTAVTGT